MGHWLGDNYSSWDQLFKSIIGTFILFVCFLNVPGKKKKGLCGMAVIISHGRPANVTLMEDLQFKRDFSFLVFFFSFVPQA